MSVKNDFTLNGIPIIRVDVPMPLNGFPEQVKAVQIIILVNHLMEFIMLYQLLYRVKVKRLPVLFPFFLTVKIIVILSMG